MPKSAYLLTQELKIAQVRDNEDSREWLREFGRMHKYACIDRMLKVTNERGEDPFI